jgi:hypothetical protein
LRLESWHILAFVIQRDLERKRTTHIVNALKRSSPFAFKVGKLLW